MLSDGFVAEEDAEHLVVGADEDSLADEPGRDGVGVSVEAHAEHLSDSGGRDIVGVEGHL